VQAAAIHETDASDTVWCGGKWPEPLLNEMAAAGATV